MYRESLKSAKHVARSKREACLWKTIYRRSTEGQKNLNNSKAPASCCLTLEPEKQGDHISKFMDKRETIWINCVTNFRLKMEEMLELWTCGFHFIGMLGRGEGHWILEHGGWGNELWCGVG